MSDAARKPMTADEFIAWAMARPETEHYELVAGRVEAMAPERVGHVEAKFAVTLRLREAIAAAEVPCRAYIDGLVVRTDEHTVFEPDGLVRCGPKLDDGVVEVSDPIIIVEVVSPSSGKRDHVLKLKEYFRLPSLHHYLIISFENRSVVHHARAADGSVATRLMTGGPLRLEPPGIVLGDVFALD